MQPGVFDQLLQYFQDGGFVMPPLVVATLILWFALGWRLMTLQRGSTATLRELVKAYAKGEREGARGIVDRAAMRGVALAKLDLDDLRGYLDDAFGDLELDMKQFNVLVKAIVAVAPLTGLLGTVTGMIETFDSLASMSLFSQSGGIAGGISVALVSTQMGLAVAIPGLVVGRILDRKQERLASELEELKEVLCSNKNQEPRTKNLVDRSTRSQQPSEVTTP
ncbi:MotA/TolQ/ExbB proton channel family protein [Persicimonas caeni]|uniref:MotA/TolQ/ExbB proton channel family protein n=1 Tax=Persicimonas caeni TaxID=2292766 RepID=A0A4Y6PSI2_PERCE|nr:MotA/TolQ/ExbB proton channel family protein [Persicimonas caeni]QDG51193.1 MotA/TolQ/ExbB proton channel family protein [Persicimonas caeni]QED32414.1 MotA/TolQ/ExbB proton channel family protein [Persicimonas caeni]